VSYSSLPAGNYRVFARTVDGSGRPGPEVQLLAVHVAAPLWQRWWVLLLAVVLAGGGVWAWSRYRIRQALKLHAVRDRIANDLHDEVGSSLSAITIGSELAARSSSSENEQVRQLIARIGETSSASLRSMSDIVWAIDPKNDEGEALVKRLRRIAHDLLERKGVPVDLIVGDGVEELRLPMDARKELLLIGKEAMHNASKHAGAQQVTVTLGLSGRRLTLDIRDDGKGFDPARTEEGHGMHSMRQRALALGAVLHVAGAPGQGTHILVTVDVTRIRD
jgi:signal transduction histidine kinase